MDARDKILDKLQKLKAHAESAAKIGSAEEAEAFAAMLQQLMMKHKISMTDLEVEEEAAADPVDQQIINWDDVKVRSNRVAWIERLASIVARAYFCRILVHPGSSKITLVGRKSDIAVAEFMIVTLTRLAEKLAKKEFGVVYRQNRHAAHGFKDTFLKSFIVRLGERFDEERNAAVRETMAIVRVNAAEAAVADFMKQFTKKAAIVKGSRQDPNALGWRRGREVADQVSLRARAMEAGNTVVKGALR